MSRKLDSNLGIKEVSHGYKILCKERQYFRIHLPSISWSFYPSISLFFSMHPHNKNIIYFLCKISQAAISTWTIIFSFVVVYFLLSGILIFIKFLVLENFQIIDTTTKYTLKDGRAEDNFIKYQSSKAILKNEGVKMQNQEYWGLILIIWITGCFLNSSSKIYL